MPQLKTAIAELQGQGYPIPDYPENPGDDEQREVRARYDKVKGSAVNPVLREGNSDRRAAASVKEYARKHPHSMGAWSHDSRSHVSTMSDGDFRSTERSITVKREGAVRIEQVAQDGSITVLKEQTPVLAGEVLDGAVMRRGALDDFLAAQMAEAMEQGVLFSVHLKATMMKVSDPIIFGHAVRAYFADVFAEHREALERAGVNANDGVAALLTAIEKLPPDRERRGSRGDRRRLPGSPAAGDGRFRPRDHEPARAQRRDHRRIDACRDPHQRPDVECQGRAAGHEVRDPRSFLCAAVRRDRRSLPRARRVRPGDDGLHPERGPDGPSRRGVRLARQDFRDCRNRRGPGRGR